MLPIVPPTKTHQNKKNRQHRETRQTGGHERIETGHQRLPDPAETLSTGPAPDGAGLPEAGLRLALPQERAEKKPDRAHSENDQTGLGQPGQNPAGCPDPVEILGG